MNLYSSYTNQPISIGAVVEYLPGRNGKYIMWAKVLGWDHAMHMVHLRSAFAGEGWYDPADIGAYIGNKRKPGEAGKKHLAYIPETDLGVTPSPGEAPLLRHLATTQGGKTFSYTIESNKDLQGHTLLAVTGPELDAILAGLRLLQSDLDIGDRLTPQLRDIYTNNGAHLGISVDEIDALCVRLNVT